ncbi:serine dehydratase [Spirochaetia bacterium]|nr:serine dehydratase [Spirochaetia bacterium]
MAKIFYPDFFNDILGPVMQPGSSTSFAGNSRVGHAASFTVKGPLKSVKIRFFSEGQFRRLGNMMEDRAFLGGLQGFWTDDERLFQAHELAREKGISYEFGVLDHDNSHDKAVRFDLEDHQGIKGSLIGSSVGGGMIEVLEINGFPILWRGDTHGVLIIRDSSSQPKIDAFIAAQGDAVVENNIFKNAVGREASFIELSALPTESLLEKSLADTNWRLFQALLPVVTFKGRKPQLFRTVDEWIAYAKDKGISFVQAAIEYEKAFSGWDDAKIWDYFKKLREILFHQIHALEDRGTYPVADTPLLPVYGKFWKTYKDAGKSLQDPLTSRIMDYAFSTNAKIPGVKIVPGPMGTGGGYLFSALEAVREARGLSVEKQIEGLAIAAGLGAIAYSNCHCSGASGCVGESGMCCAMGSGAVTWMAGGTGEQVQWAASMALQANIGIPCDPIPGGLEFPCLTRTVRSAVTAPLYADMALAGIDPLIPFHEMLTVIEHTRALYGPAVTGPGCGACGTETAERCGRFLREEVMEGKLKWEAEVSA